jgi:lipoate---protein ligase
MLIFFRTSTDPYINIAAEEYFVKHATEDMCMIWVNTKSVIIGKHQNAFAEINYPFVRSENIPVIRRISGGGAVYHDTGNVNFTFIKKTEESNQVNFSRFTSVIVSFMQSLGIEVNVGKRNSLFIRNLKFSGHAEHIFHDRVLHHGTILFNTDLEALQKSLKPGKEYTGKSMASVRNDVVNIAPLLSESIGIKSFIQKFITWLLMHFPESKSYEISEYEGEAIRLLSETKYKTWNWNFGYSPKYEFQVQIPTITHPVQMLLKVENGHFVEINISDNHMNKELKDIFTGLTGLMHNEQRIEEFIKKNKHRLELAGANTVKLSEIFF